MVGEEQGRLKRLLCKQSWSLFTDMAERKNTAVSLSGRQRGLYNSYNKLSTSSQVPLADLHLHPITAFEQQINP